MDKLYSISKTADILGVSQKTLRVWDKQNKLIKGVLTMPYCPYCGSEVLSGSNFCPSCGKNLAEPNKSEEATSSFENGTSSSKNRFASIMLPLCL